MLLCAACEPRQPKTTSAVFSADESGSSDTYDLREIENSGELIGITVYGPDTYYEFRGREFGLHHDLAEAYARHLGIRLRTEVAHDTAEAIRRMHEHEADVVLLDMKPQTGSLHTAAGWLVNPESKELAQSIAEWYSPQLLQSIQAANQQTKQPPRRHTRPVMLDAATGQISQWDHLFQQHTATIGWDWRLMAAQCYQESGFDPQAVSWAGAQGLMQIMPATFSTLGMEGDPFDPETNVKASVLLLNKLNGTFSDIPARSDRIPFVLAAYNGGASHVRDAMALARKNGKNDRVWREVEPYILLLSQPQYYNDPVVQHGYLRGEETYHYVQDVLERWADYRGQARNHSKASQPAPSKNSKNPTTIRRPDSLAVHL